MKLTGLQIDAFGVWHNLSLPDFSDGMTAFYGPNEAGKTTVLQFIRTVLYGASPERAKKYLPPLAGDRWGGTLRASTVAGQLRITRELRTVDDGAGRVRIATEGGGAPAGADLRSILSGIDETTYNNIYAVGLRELQELGTLSDTDAADWLYGLTSGFDRVSLLDVMRKLSASRDDLLSSDAADGQIIKLAAQRESLQASIDHLAGNQRAWAQFHNELEELGSKIEALQGERDRLEDEGRTVEIAVQLVPRWSQREDVARQLARFDGRPRLPETAIDELEELNERIAQHQNNRQVLRGQREALREEADALGINDVLVRNASRIEALGEQKDWLEALERQATSIRAELSEIQTQLATENERLGVDLKHSAKKEAPEISESLLSSLRPHAKAMRGSRERLLAAERDAITRQEAYEEYQAQLNTAMPPASDGMPTDLEEAGELVAALRRRVQVDQRLTQSERNLAELEDQGHDLLDRQELPLWIEAAHTFLIIVGVALFAVGLLANATVSAWIGGIMLAVLIALRIFKYVGEEQIAARRESNDRQVELVQKQLHETRIEKDELERELGSVEGSVVVRLQAAERHLAELEKLLPIDSRLREARREAEAAQRRAEDARRKLENARSAWRGKLAAAGLPKDWTPHDLRTMAGRYEQISELRMRVARRRDDAQQRQREHTTLCQRIHNLAEEVGLLLAESDPPAQLEYLLSELRQHQTKVAERQRLRRRAREHRSQELKHKRAAAQLGHRRETTFQRVGMDDEAGYRKLYAEQQQADKLRKQHAAITREISAAIGRHAPEETFAKLMDTESGASLERRWEQVTASLDAVDGQIKELVQQRGAVSEKRSQLAEDRTLSEKQLELATVTTRLHKAIRAWKVRAATCTVLERIRAHYETHRQPETLIEASKFLHQMTDGAYRRIWTPLGKTALFVDVQDGEPIPVDMLSRGTREQLFLAVRLALVAMLSRRGVRLPIVLDDVLVNFDAHRARLAAVVLKEFSAQGHQVLMFTCHEHIREILRDLQLDIRRLPDRFGRTIQPEPRVEVAPKIEVPVAAPIVKPEVFAPATEAAPNEETLVPDDYELEAPIPVRAHTLPHVEMVDRVDEEDTVLEPEEIPTSPPPAPRAPKKKVRRRVHPEVVVPSFEVHRDEWERVGTQVRRKPRIDRRDAIDVLQRLDRWDEVRTNWEEVNEGEHQPLSHESPADYDQLERLPDNSAPRQRIQSVWQIDTADRLRDDEYAEDLGANDEELFEASEYAGAHEEGDAYEAEQLEYDEAYELDEEDREAA